MTGFFGGALRAFVASALFGSFGGVAFDDRFLKAAQQRARTKTQAGAMRLA